MAPPRDTRTRRSAAETRERVLDVAHELFYWQGIRSTGVDTIARTAGIAPTTLYRLFASKDELVAAYVERAATHHKDWFAAATRSSIGSPRARILALFDALGEEVQPERCRGCPFLMVLAELPDSGHAGHSHAVAVKAWVREQLGELTAELASTTPVRAPAALADALALLMDGVYGSVQSFGVTGPAARARAIAEMLLDAAGRVDDIP